MGSTAGKAKGQVDSGISGLLAPFMPILRAMYVGGAIVGIAKPNFAIVQGA
jgi:hypothetical protein